MGSTRGVWPSFGERRYNKDDAELDDQQGCQARIPDPLSPGVSGMAAAAALAKELGRIGACPAVDSLAV
jgi:hypothetical protein